MVPHSYRSIGESICIYIYDDVLCLVVVSVKMMCVVNYEKKRLCIITIESEDIVEIILL